MSDNLLKEFADLASMLSLTRPLVGLDCETTGTAPKIDRVIQVGIIKIYPDGKVTEWKSLINPGEPIPPSSTEVHHITDEMVRDAPVFRNVAPLISLGLKDCDVCGYSVNFDLQMIKAEFQRLNQLTPEWGQVIDVELIYKKHRRRTLADCVEEYLGEKMQDAHDALEDVRWTLRSLRGQLGKVPELPQSVEGLHDHLNKVADGEVCSDRKIIQRNGVMILNFTSKSGTPLRQLDNGMLDWITRQDFVSDAAKEIVRQEQQRRRQ